ncbi:MAG: T9SS type A sorting domain-containing protein [Flavobacteriales bacterium]
MINLIKQITLLLILSPFISFAQDYPSFGPEIDVTIQDLNFDAMEPFISPDGSHLLFNSLNDGVNTKLYYASRMNDSTFTFIGEVNGPNQPIPPHLDAVADLDSQGNFYWTSTRDYPSDLDNLFHGSYEDGVVTEIGRVRGDFNKNTPGWLVMDHGISHNGQFLYYNNARFDDNNCQGICETELGIAQKVNDSTFNTTPDFEYILQNIIDSSYIYYAPCISSDDLEFYYSRYPRDTVTVNTLFEICVAVRNTDSDPFSTPAVLFSELIGDLIEAPTLTVDKQILYYHRKVPGSHKVVMRYREASNSIAEENLASMISIYPNPAQETLYIQSEIGLENLKVSLFNLLGEEVLVSRNQLEIKLMDLSSGTYFVRIEMDGNFISKRVVILD